MLCHTPTFSRKVAHNELSFYLNKPPPQFTPLAQMKTQKYEKNGDRTPPFSHRTSKNKTKKNLISFTSLSKQSEFVCELKIFLSSFLPPFLSTLTSFYEEVSFLVVGLELYYMLLQKSLWVLRSSWDSIDS